MKKYAYLLICILILNNTNGMKRDLQEVFEDLEDGLNPWDDPLSKCTKSNFLNALPQVVNGHDLPKNEPIVLLPDRLAGLEVNPLVKDGEDKLINQIVVRPKYHQDTERLIRVSKEKDHTEKLVVKEDKLSYRKTENKNNDDLVYLTKYFRRLYVGGCVYDGYHAVPPSLLHMMICGGLEFDSYTRLKKDNSGLLRGCQRILPSMTVKINNNNVDSKIKFLGVCTYENSSMIVHVGLKEKIVYDQGKHASFLQRILDCQYSYPNFLINVVKICHKYYLPNYHVPTKDRLSEVEKVLKAYQHNNEISVTVSVENASKLSGFFHKPIVCDYPDGTADDDKIIYFPLNTCYPAGVFISPHWIKKDLLNQNAVVNFKNILKLI
ncbi:hypothetical protein EKK58_01695 [Candidatus Dependentiae bacterium]|nr:MAG: hypothetical protein EKK58_01695 [Candidatus Dependentiae bacterium]